jgi:hypothetical protein
VDDDAALVREVIHAALEPEQAQRVAVQPEVRLARAEQTEARLLRPRPVGEGRRAAETARAPVRDELAEAHGPAREVEHPEPRLGGGQRIVHHGEQRLRELAARVAACERAEREVERLGTDSRRREALEGRRVDGQGVDADRRRAFGARDPRERDDEDGDRDRVAQGDLVGSSGLRAG